MGAAKAYAPPGASAPRVTPTAIKREVDAALRQVADTVAALPAPYIKALGPILDQAQRETTEALAAWLASHPNDGAQRFTAQHLRQAQLQLRAALIHAEKRIPAQVVPVLNAMGNAAGKQAMRDLQLEVSAMAGAFGHSVRPLQLPQAAILAEGRAQLIPRFRNSANRYGSNISADIRRELAVGVAKGETFDQLTTRLVKLGGPKGLVALRGSLGDPGVVAEHIGEGLFKRYRFWAERVVRTECAEAYSVHALNSLHAANEDDPGYEKRWDAALVRDRTCPVCVALDGKAVALDAEFPGGYKHPPAHPLCLCTLTPWRPEWGGKAEPPKQAPDVAPPPAAPPQKPAPAPPPPPAPKPPRARKPPPAPPPAAAPPPPAPPPPPPKPAHVDGNEHIRSGDFAAARGPIERDMAGPDFGFAFAPHTKNAVTQVAPLPPGIGGTHRLADGTVTVAPQYARAAESFAATALSGNKPSLTEINGMQVYAHELIHGTGPVGPGAYRGVGALIEEVTTETAARQYMLTRYGTAVAGAYDGEIAMVRSAVAAVYGTDQAIASALLTRASMEFRKRGTKTSNARAVVTQFVSSFPDPRARAALEGFLHTYHQRILDEQAKARARARKARKP